jgi:hypothetical protein
VISKTNPFVLKAGFFVVMNWRARRLDDRIRELCAEAVAAKSSHKAREILGELQSALRQYTQRLRGRTAAMMTGRPLPPERRKI